ncbi:hypothetical protein C8A05DRAFT_18769 [Staphylotrichum tortipilum]|uniref:Uncharacterized protein n=1 Tax=Staphylotrichum tortipilum TaxID=2831512 RepID=A0AAN6MEB1_9PEZI|nr:hypothetical protein C8A05DRAFT_18769 [Staphylotrichum longicolle]
MKAVPGPVSAARKAASHARPHNPGPSSMLPRHTAVDLALRARHAQQLAAPVCSRRASVTSHSGTRISQHTRRSSGSRSLLFDAKINKNPSHQNQIGLWLEKVDVCRRPGTSVSAHPPPLPEPAWQQTPPSTTLTADAALIAIRNSGSPRVPLADITPFVLAAESDASTFYSSSTVDVELPPQRQGRPRPIPDITGAINLLTADETSRLLLLSAQSNTSLAAAIRDIAVARSSRQQPEPQVDMELADTFIFEEHRLESHV